MIGNRYRGLPREPKLIRLVNHPSNFDPTAKLVSGPGFKALDIYSVRGGFLACYGAALCLEGLFRTMDDAALAQQRHLRISGKEPI